MYKNENTFKLIRKIIFLNSHNPQKALKPIKLISVQNAKKPFSLNCYELRLQKL